MEIDILWGTICFALGVLVAEVNNLRQRLKTKTKK